MLKTKILIKLLFLIIVSSNLFVSANLFGQNMLASSIKPEDLKQKLVSHQKWVPFPKYKDRLAWDNFTKENKTSLIKRGEKNLNYEWKVIKATDYLEYERSGDRNIMQIPNANNYDALSDLVMAELAEGKGRFMDQIVNGVFLQCERTSWVLSAHLTYQHSKRTLPDHTEQVIDLGSADLGGLLSWVYFFFNQEFDKINPIISKRLKKELYDKIIIPYRTEDRFFWMGYKLQEEGIVNNWNPWCNFDLLQTVMLIENDTEQLSKDVYLTMQSVDKFINFIKKDGACEEGPAYWGHAAGKLYDYLKMLSLATDGKVNFFKEKLIRDMGEYMPRTYVGNDWVVNFADASAKFATHPGLVYRYGKAVGSKEMMGFSSFLVKKGKPSLSNGLDIFRILESLQYDAELRNYPPDYQSPNISQYPLTEFYYVKNDSGIFLATKGGHNNESHNHNDIGTFNLYYNQKPLIIDAGVGTYKRQTFGPERYTLWPMKSSYHNLPSINGQEQRYGGKYKSNKVNLDTNKNAFSIDLSKAYPIEANISSWVRSYQITGKVLVVKDNFSLSSATKENEINFMIRGDIDISAKNKVIVKMDDIGFVLSYDGKIFEPKVERIDLPDKRLSSVWGPQIYRLTLKAKVKPIKANWEYRITTFDI